MENLPDGSPLCMGPPSQTTITLPRQTLHERYAGNPRPARHLRSYADTSASKAPIAVALARSSRRPLPRPSPDARPWSLESASFHEAPACVAPAATSKSRFRRSKPDGHADAGHFFYPRPLLAQPASNLPLVPLAGLPLRLLGSDSTLGQPLIDVVRMELLAKLALDQLASPAVRSTVRWENRTRAASLRNHRST